MEGRRPSTGRALPHIVGVLALAVVLLLALAACGTPDGETGDDGGDTSGDVSEEDVERFRSIGLETDFGRAAVDLDLLLGGGPVKDGIPALTEPEYVSIEEAQEEQQEQTRGLFIEIEGEHRFYPFSILVWHEVVNDSVGDTHFAATF